MLNTLVLIVGVSLFNIPYTKVSAGFVDDYCWRDYDGYAPVDAFKAGIDKNGDAIYIGQTLYDNKLIPGKIHQNKQGIHIEFFQAFLINETIKILCTKHPENFEWIETSFTQIKDIKGKHLFEGGYEEGVTTYIGRAQSHGELTVGKVICWPNRCIKLTTIEDGEWTAHEEFEILTYKSNKVTQQNVNAVPTVSSYSSSPSPSPSSATFRKRSKNNPSFLNYFFLVIGVAVLVVLVIVLIRRC